MLSYKEFQSMAVKFKNKHGIIPAYELQTLEYLNEKHKIYVKTKSKFKTCYDEITDYLNNNNNLNLGNNFKFIIDKVCNMLLFYFMSKSKVYSMQKDLFLTGIECNQFQITIEAPLKSLKKDLIQLKYCLDYVSEINKFCKLLNSSLLKNNINNINKTHQEQYFMLTLSKELIEYDHDSPLNHSNSKIVSAKYISHGKTKLACEFRLENTSLYDIELYHILIIHESGANDNFFHVRLFPAVVYLHKNYQ